MAIVGVLLLLQTTAARRLVRDWIVDLVEARTHLSNLRITRTTQDDSGAAYVERLSLSPRNGTWFGELQRPAILSLAARGHQITRDLPGTLAGDDRGAEPDRLRFAWSAGSIVEVSGRIDNAQEGRLLDADFSARLGRDALVVWPQAIDRLEGSVGAMVEALQENDSPIAGGVTATLNLETSTLNLADVRGHMHFESATVSIGDIPVTLSSSDDFTFANGRLDVPDIAIASRAGRLLVGRLIDLSTDTPSVDVSVTGTADLRPASAFVSFAVVGTTTSALRITGPLHQLVLDGEFALQNAGLLTREPRLALTDISGVIRAHSGTIAIGPLNRARQRRHSRDRRNGRHTSGGAATAGDAERRRCGPL